MAPLNLWNELVGKLVQTKLPLRDNNCKIIKGKYDTIVGPCNYIGPNEYLGYQLQITVGGMPIEVIHINDIVLK